MTLFTRDALSGRHVLITGATGGIGYESAKLVASLGAKVSATGRNESKLQKLHKELLTITNEDNIHCYVADLAIESERNELVEACENKLGFISGLVNTAGIVGSSVLEDIEEDLLTNMMHVNYTSMVMLTKLVYKRMLERKQGDIINLSSMSGLRGTFSNTAYSASKFAVIGFTESLAAEAAPHNIRVNAICPGFVETEMMEKLFRERAERSGLSYEEQLTNAKKAVPTGEIISTSEVANLIVFLLSGVVKNMIGESIKITGGRK